VHEGLTEAGWDRGVVRVTGSYSDDCEGLSSHFICVGARKEDIPTRTFLLSGSLLPETLTLSLIILE
jgi:hypothetical protein